MIKLTKQQHAAVVHSGSPALVVAGAGAGKTRTLTARISHLIENGADPSSRIFVCGDSASASSADV